jgi:hypothetical protein
VYLARFEPEQLPDSLFDIWRGRMIARLTQGAIAAALVVAAFAAPAMADGLDAGQSSDAVVTDIGWGTPPADPTPTPAPTPTPTATTTDIGWG